jgi:hypothetical protein
MKDIGKFYGPLVCFPAISYTNFMAIWYILWSFWCIFSSFGTSATLVFRQKWHTYVRHNQWFL